VTTAHLEYKPRWTAADLELFPSEFRAEIVHGGLLVNPAPSKRHQLIIRQLLEQLEPTLPGGWTVVFDIDVILAEDHTRRPDLAVVREATIDVNPTPPSEVAIIVEVVSPGSETVDRRDKPEAYANARIPAYWRIETKSALALISYDLVGDGYVEHEPVTDTFTTQQPWPITIDVPDLKQLSPRR
jgi:Uma2 family endonuclease